MSPKNSKKMSKRNTQFPQPQEVDPNEPHPAIDCFAGMTFVKQIRFPRRVASLHNQRVSYGFAILGEEEMKIEDVWSDVEPFFPDLRFDLKMSLMEAPFELLECIARLKGDDLACERDLIIVFVKDETIIRVANNQ